MSQRCFNYSDRTYQVKSEYTRTVRLNCPAAPLIEVNVFSVTNLESKQEKRGAATMMYSENYKDASCHIWQTYANTRKQDYILRVGFTNYGCHSDDNHAEDYSRAESVAEHTLGTMTLIELMEMFYPDEGSPEIYARCKRLMRFHDLGETTAGDTPDNGTRDKAAINLAEYTCLNENILHLPNDVKKAILSDFDIFNGSPKELTGEDLKVHELCKLADKTDAILRGLVYEQHHHCGHYANVPEGTGSKRESEYEKVMNSDKLVDIFFAGFIKDYHQYSYFPIFLDIIRAAIIDVRRKWYDNWEEIVTKLGISDKEYDLHTFQKK